MRRMRLEQGGYDPASSLGGAARMRKAHVVEQQHIACSPRKDDLIGAIRVAQGVELCAREVTAIAKIRLTRQAIFAEQIDQWLSVTAQARHVEEVRLIENDA